MSMASRRWTGGLLLAGGLLSAAALHHAWGSAPLPRVGPKSALGPSATAASFAVTAPRGGTIRRAPILFVENVGQSELPGRFVAGLAHGNAAFRQDGFLLQFVEQRPPDREARRCARVDVPRPEVRGLNLCFTFEGASPTARVCGEQRLATHVNVYDGHDPGAWHEDIPAFAAVRCSDTYPGVDVLYHDAQGTLEYDLLVEPDADLSSVVLKCEGTEGMTVDGDGSLELKTALGPWHLPPPNTYVDDGGKRQSIACRYRALSERQIGFEVEGWDRRTRLVIDPSVAYASYLGGTGLGDVTLTVAVDASGCAYAGGTGGGTGFPTTPGAFLTSSPAGSAYVSKITADGSALVYSTYLAKVSSTGALAVTANGEAIAQCRTNNVSFPTTSGAYDTTFNGTKDFWDTAVAKLDAEGGHLIFSTFIGGTADDSPADIALGPDDTIYLTGWTKSPDYPTTPGALLEIGNGKNVFVTKLAPDGTSLIWSTLLGSPIYDEEAFGLAVEPGGSPIIVGRTAGVDLDGFPVTPGAYDTTHNGNWDVFVTRLDPGGSRLVFSTYLGAEDVDEANDVCIAPDGSLYVVGRTASFAFPTTAGVIQPFTKGFGDGFISHLSADGSTLLHSTFLGSSLGDEIYAVGINPQGNIVIADDIGNPAYVTPDAVTSVASAAMLHVLDATLSKLVFGSFIGGEYQKDMVIDAAGLVYVAGATGSATFATPGAFDTSLAGTFDGFVLKFDLSPWKNLGQGLAGTGGLVPQLAGLGTLQPGSPGALSLTQARPLSPVTLVIGLQIFDAPFKGGTLVPAPLLFVPLATDVSGGAVLPWVAWPTGLPAGTNIVLQAWVTDPLAPKGLAASNGLLAVTPVPKS